MMMIDFHHLVHAGIETLVVASVASFLGVSVAAATVITSVLTIGALYAVNALLAPRGGGENAPQANSVDPARAKGTFSSAEAPELRIVGRARVGGLKAFGNTAGANRYRLIFHCKGTISGVEQYFFGGREIVVDSSGLVKSYPWSSGASSSYAQVLTKLGSDNETAWPSLITDFPNLWTTAHRARGIAQTLLKFVSPGTSNELFLKLYQGGVPDLEVVLRGEDQVYDPRIGERAWTDNGILCALHVLLTFPEFSVADIDMSQIATEAQRADQVIETRAGLAARSRCWGVWSSETPRGDTLSKVLESVGAMIVPRGEGGTKIGVELIEDNPEPEITIPLKHIVSLSWKSGPDGVERPNICRLKYYSPERNYDMGEIDLSGIGWARVQSEVDAYGEKYFDVDLPFCPDAGQAQRIARRKFMMARADSGVAMTNMAGLAAWGCRNIALEFPDGIGTKVVAIAPPRVKDGDGLVEIPFVVLPELTEWDLENDEADAPAQVPDMSISTLTTPSPPSEATVVVYPDTSRASRIALVLPVGASGLEAAYRTYSRGLPNAWLPMAVFFAVSGYAHAYASVNLEGQYCEFRVRAYSDDGSSKWSPLLQTTPALNLTAPSAPTIACDVTLDVGGSGYTRFVFTLTVPDDLWVAWLTFTGTLTVGLSVTNLVLNSPIAVVPGQVITVTYEDNNAGDFEFVLTAHSSNGTPSTSDTFTYTV